MGVKTFGDERRRRYLEEHRVKRPFTDTLILGIGVAAFLGLLILPFLYPNLLKEQPHTYNVIVTCE